MEKKQDTIVKKYIDSDVYTEAKKKNKTHNKYF